MSHSPFTFEPAKQHTPAVRLLNSHDTGHGMFISHLDRHPASLKFLVFLPPLFMYMSLAGIMAWRIISSTSHYLPGASMLANLLDPSSDPSDNQGPETKWFYLVLNGLFDMYIYTYGWPLLRRFATTHLLLRLKHGFKDTEVVFRVPTGSRRLALNSLPPDQAEQAFGAALSRAIDRRFLAENPGFNTRSDFWVLNYKAMLEATTLASYGSLSLDEWDLRVWQRNEEGKWTVWEAFRLHDMNSNKLGMDIVKEKLLAQNKGAFVEKWEDLIQRSNKPGSNDDQVDIRAAVMQLFKSEGLNLESLWSDALSEAQQRISRPVA